MSILSILLKMFFQYSVTIQLRHIPDDDMEKVKERLVKITPPSITLLNGASFCDSIKEFGIEMENMSNGMVRVCIELEGPHDLLLTADPLSMKEELRIMIVTAREFLDSN